ncbi:MAG: DinB family protein [Chloroflexota bacterium]|nr:DinB family protein [Chloroflexota bacterium]MDE2893957.1 DinB family protein [Chloroflexota bacterium]
MNAESRADLLARFEAAPKLLADSVAGSSIAQLDGAPPEPGWTARENVHHVSDVAIMAGLRLRLMLLDIEVEMWPIDGDAMQKRLRNDRRPIGPALRTVDGLVESACSILGSLREDEWTQPRPVPVARSRSVEEWLEASVGHIEQHVDQIRYALTGTC